MTVATVSPVRTVATISPEARVALLDRGTDTWVAVLEDVVALANNIANTEFVPTSLRGSVPKVVAAIMHGRELGLPPMTALAQTFIIGGRPGTYAEMQRALILAAGHQFRVVEQTEARCVMKCRRADWPLDEWATFSFTMQEAQRAGYARTNANYQKAPADMLLARCTGRMAKATFADVIHGLSTVEELMDLGPEGEAAVPPVPQTTTKVSRQGASPAPAVEGGTATAAPGGAAAPEGTGEVPQAEAAEEQTAAPARKRAPLKPRGRATQPVPEPTAPDDRQYTAGAAVGTGLEPADEEPVEAELVPDAPEAKPSNVRPLDAARSAAKDGMVRTVQMQFQRLLGKPVDREERLWYTGLIVGRVVESTNDLDGDDLRKLLKTLERLRNREQLEALNQGGE